MTYQAHFFGFQRSGTSRGGSGRRAAGGVFLQQAGFVNPIFPGWMCGACAGRWGVLQKHKQRSHDFTRNRWLLPFTNSVSIPVLQIKGECSKPVRSGWLEGTHLILSLQWTGWYLQAHPWRRRKEKNLGTIVSPLRLKNFAQRAQDRQESQTPTQESKMVRETDFFFFFKETHLCCF